MPHTGDDTQLELALHLADHELAIESFRAREHQEACRARPEEQLR